MYSAAWNALVTNFGRPQTIVKAQVKRIHLSPFIKSHDSGYYKVRTNDHYMCQCVETIQILKRFIFRVRLEFSVEEVTN